MQLFKKNFRNYYTHKILGTIIVLRKQYFFNALKKISEFGQNSRKLQEFLSEQMCSFLLKKFSHKRM